MTTRRDRAAICAKDWPRGLILELWIMAASNATLRRLLARLALAALPNSCRRNGGQRAMVPADERIATRVCAMVSADGRRFAE